MTNEEAIKTIEVAIAEVEWNYPLYYAEAFEVAIEALRTQTAAVERLAAYEDTGLEPCDYSAMRAVMDQADKAKKDLSELIHIVGAAGIDHLRELVEAEKDGRLIVLPCKVGDAVYMPVGRWNTITGYGEDKCDGFHIAQDGILQIKAQSYTGSHGTYGVPGKTVFLTREEAEAALTEENEKQ